MIQDPLLKAVLKRAEFDEKSFFEDNADSPTWIGCAKGENARLMPIIEGLCEEVQRLEVLKRETVKCLEQCSLVLNGMFSLWLVTMDSDNIADKMLDKIALSTSALEKLVEG